RIKNNITEFGTYLVTATYYDYGNPIVVKSTFLFSSVGDNKQDGECQTTYCVYHVELGSVIYPIYYELSAGRLTEIGQNGGEDALLIQIDSNRNGTLSLMLPRAIFDSKSP